MTDYQPGDRVHIVFEGIVKQHAGGDAAVIVQDADGIVNVSPSCVELIERPTRFPEPTEPGTVVRVEYTPGFFMVYELLGRWEPTNGDTDCDWVDVIDGASSVTVLWPKDQPQWVETEAEYAALPVGSVVAEANKVPFTKTSVWHQTYIETLWSGRGCADRSDPGLAGTRRQVLRHGWGEA